LTPHNRIVALALALACTSATRGSAQADQHPSKQPAPPSFANSEGEVRGVWEDIEIRDAELANRRYANVTLLRCAITANDLVRGASFEYVTFRNCGLSDLTLLGTEGSRRVVGDVRLIDCDVQDLSIEAADVDRLVLERGHVGRLELRRSRVRHLEIVGAAVDELLVTDCETDVCVLSSQTRLGRCRITGGRLASLDLAGLQTDGQIELSRLELMAAHITKTQSRQVDLAGAIGLGERFKLQQELDAASDRFGKATSRDLFADAEQCYHAIASRLMNDGLKDPALRMRYRAAVCHREGTTEGLDRAFSIVWGEYLRGQYGTSWLVVLQVALVVWAVFTALYWALGWCRYCWAMEVTATADGVLWRSDRPRVVLPYGERSLVDYSLCAMVFSLENLLLIGGRTFQFGAVADLIKPTPKGLIGIGVGRILAFIEGVIGLVLIVNFLQAFIAAL